MNIKPSITSILLALCFLVFAFLNAEARIPAKRIFPMGALNEFIKTDTGGRTVNLDSAQACINRFTALMTAHGFAKKAGLPINITLTQTSQITTGESFDGQGLLDWLNVTAAQYAAAGKKLMIKVQMGVYDMNYLKTYISDPAKRTASNNRIAIFIIPYDASSGITVRGLAQPQGGGGTQGGTGYDLGGVQP
jgi:hypothetical protein